MVLDLKILRSRKYIKGGGLTAPPLISDSFLKYEIQEWKYNKTPIFSKNLVDFRHLEKTVNHTIVLISSQFLIARVSNFNFLQRWGSNSFRIKSCDGFRKLPHKYPFFPKKHYFFTQNLIWVTRDWVNHTNLNWNSPILN